MTERDVNRKYKIVVTQKDHRLVDPMSGKTHVAFCLTPMPMQQSAFDGSMWCVGFLPPVEGTSLQDAIKRMQEVIKNHRRSLRKYFGYEFHHYNAEV